MDPILSIDWDYVTGDCSTDEMSHCGFCLPINHIRGAREFLEEWKPWLNKVKKIFVPRECPIYVAECHASIIEAVKLLRILPCVYDFDHHFDHYDEDNIIRCGNWIYHLKDRGGTVKSRSSKVPKSLSAVFMCLSSPWTPPCMDIEFFKLVKHFARKSRTRPIFIGHKKVYLERQYQQRLEELCQIHEHV